MSATPHRRIGPLRLSRPLWLDRGTGAAAYRRLRGDHTVDVAVVGGGFTGAAIAWRFADAGVRVALVEAARIGCGSTAASTALLMQEPDADFDDLAARYGTGRATRIWELSRSATRDLVATVRRLGIRCDLVERDSVYYALTRDGAVRLRAEHERRRRAGIGGAWLSRRRLADATGIDGVAGIRTSGNAQIDPFRCSVGLVEAAQRRGAAVFERSCVRRIDHNRRGVVIRAATGTIRADRVVIATGYATAAFKPLAGRFRMLHTYVIGTRPLVPAERRRLGLGAVMTWETGWPYHYARWTPDGRLLLGGGDRARVAERNRRRAFAKGTASVGEYFSARYPSLVGIRVDYAWEGLFAMTPDGLPYIGAHRRYPRHLFALGYGGNGMTFGFLASTLLLDEILGRASEDLALFAFNR